MQIQASDIIDIAELLQKALVGTVPGTVLEVAIRVAKIMDDASVTEIPAKALIEAIKAYENRTFDALDKI